MNPQRLLSGFSWPEFQWRRGELLSEFQGKTVLVGVDDMDVFKGIELKLLAFERVLEHHQEWRSKLVLVQVRCVPGASVRDGSSGLQAWHLLRACGGDLAMLLYWARCRSLYPCMVHQAAAAVPCYAGLCC